MIEGQTTTFNHNQRGGRLCSSEGTGLYGTRSLTFKRTGATKDEGPNSTRMGATVNL